MYDQTFLLPATHKNNWIRACHVLAGTQSQIHALQQIIGLIGTDGNDPRLKAETQTANAMGGLMLQLLGLKETGVGNLNKLVAANQITIKKQLTKTRVKDLMLDILTRACEVQEPEAGYVLAATQGLMMGYGKTNLEGFMTVVLQDAINQIGDEWSQVQWGKFCCCKAASSMADCDPNNISDHHRGILLQAAFDMEAGIQ